MMRLVLTVGGTDLEITEQGDAGPYPLLVSAGTMRVAARGGGSTLFGSNEPPSGEVTLDNADGRAAEVLGGVLRAAAQVYDDADLVFSGVVSRVRYGGRLVLGLES